MNHRLTSAGLVATATLFAASAVFAAPPQFRAPDKAVSSQIVRTGAGDDQNAPSRHHNRYDFRATQQMHAGGGGNSK